MPTLEPIREDATLDASEYVAALEAMAEAASKAAEAMGKVTAALAAQQRLMDSMAAGAAEAAAAEERLAEAEQNVGKAGAEAAAGEEAAAKATGDLGRSAATAAGFMATLTSAESRAVTVQAGMERTSRMLADSLEAVALAEEYVDQATGHANEAMAAGSLAAAQDAEAARGLAEADAGVALAEQAKAEALDAAARAAAADAFATQSLASADEAAARAGFTVAAANTAVAASADAAGAGTATGMRIGIGWLRLGVANWQTFLHWAVAGSAELLSVLIPAMVAAGAGAAVMAQGVQDAQTHLTAMYTAQEATANIFHTTIGDMLGMGHALQSAQNAADPKVWELLGAGINAAKAASGGFVKEGNQVLGVLDGFGAKVVADLQGSKLHDLLGGGVADLTAFGQVLGNTGHAVLNLASDMPGLSQVLLGLVDGASRVVEALSSMPGHIVTAYMALEEFNRWGSLAVGGMGRLGLAADTLSGSFFTFGSRTIGVMSNVVKVVPMALAALTSNLGSAMTGWGRLGGEVEAGDGIFARMGAAIGNAGMAVRGFGADMTDAIVAFPAGWAAAIGAVVAGLGLLIYHFASAKTAAQQFADSLQQATLKASDLQIYKVIGDNIAALAPRYEQAAAAAKHYSSQTDTASAGQNRLNAALGMQASQAASTYSGALTQQQRDLGNVTQAVSFLSRQYGTTFVGSLALAQAAGVNLAKGITGTGQAAIGARIQIANYVAGMRAMGEQTSSVGHDVTLLGIASALASTHVQQLQQAFSGFVTNMAGGTSNLVAMNSQLRQMGTLTQEGLQRGSQAWQNFDSTLTGSASQLVQWFQLAGTEGAVGSQKFTAGIQDIVAGMVQVASKTPASRAELVGFANAAGLSAKNFPELRRQLDAAGASGKGLASIVQAVTGRMANMNSVARALGSSLGSSVVASMNSARVGASGLGQSVQNLAVAWNHAHSINTSVIAGFRQTATSLVNVYHNTSMAKTAVDALAQQMGLTKGQIETLNSLVPQFASHTGDAASATQKAASQTSGLNGKLNELNSEISGAAGKIATAGDQIRTSGQAAQTAAGQLQNFHTQAGNAGSAAATAGGKVTSLGGNMSSAGGQAQAAAGQVYALSSAISGLQSKTITITTNMVTNVSHRAGGGPVAAGVPYLVGEAGQEMFVPSVPGTIVPHGQTQQMMAGGGSGGSGGGPQVIEVHAELHHSTNLDGQAVANGLQPYVLRFERRNGFQWSQAQG